ncbi:MAG: hypothetical protein ACI8R4_003567, partial [Paracoccaceae bacterium]
PLVSVPVNKKLESAKNSEHTSAAMTTKDS